jgi:hypothetical protein
MGQRKYPGDVWLKMIKALRNYDLNSAAPTAAIITTSLY